MKIFASQWREGKTIYCSFTEKKGRFGLNILMSNTFTNRNYRPYWEYFGRGVANRTSGAYQACDGVQLKTTTNFIRDVYWNFH